jgi:hypothetical protein
MLTRALPPMPAPESSGVMNERDADRLELLDRIADRVPELDLDRQSVEWSTLDTATRR